MDDDDDMADLYLSRKITGASTPASGSGVPNWASASPTIGSKISRASKASAATIHGNENDVEELEMLLEVTCSYFSILMCFEILYNLTFKILFFGFCYPMQAYFMQIDSTLNKMTTVSL